MFGRFSKILVVDDSLVQRKIMRGMLNGMGFENIDEAHNGRVALAMLGAHAYRLVLSDWDMPDMNGVDLLDAMRADPRLRRIPFVMVTAHAKRFGDVARDARHALSNQTIYRRRASVAYRRRCGMRRRVRQRTVEFNLHFK